MKLISIEAQNFLSFKELEYDFPSSGLFFIGGQVSDSKTTTSNGAGKSSFAEAICWTLFGKTIRGVSKDDIINRTEGKDCCCSAYFTIESSEKVYNIMRTRDYKGLGNSLFLFCGDEELTKSDMNETQEEIESLLGLNWLVFSNAVIFGEQARRFSQAKDSEKKAIFDDILLMHQYLEAQKAVKEDKKELKTSIIDTEYSVKAEETILASVIKDLETNDSQLLELKEESKTVNEQIAEKMTSKNQLNADLEVLNKQKEQAEKDYLELDEENKTIFECVNKLTAEQQEALATLFSDSQKIQIELGTIRSLITEVERTLTSTADVEADTRCRACGQIVTELSAKEVQEHYQSDLLGLKEKEKKLEAGYKLATDKLNEEKLVWDKKVDEATQTKLQLDEVLVEKKDVVRDCDVKIISLSSNIKTIEDFIENTTERLKYKEDSLMKIQADLLGRRNDTGIKIGEKKEKIENLTIELRYLDFWIEGFGNQGIKSLLLDEVVPALNNKVSYYASALFDDQIRIEFNTETTLKSGESRDKFSVNIFSETKEIEYATCSAGERGRIDTAILLALQSLIFSRSAGGCNFVIMDEILEHLDSIGIERIVNLLGEEAKEKAIFLISHVQELGDSFDNQILIRKNIEGFSELEV